jgi:F-type H+-transporting ATPase subunit delta
MSIVDKRYAEALFNVSLEENAIKEYQDDLIALVDIYKANSEFRGFLLHPQNDVKTKKLVLTNVFEGKIKKNTLNFLMLLQDKNRMKHLPTISAEFVRLADEHNNVLNITIFTAISLEEEYVKSICEKFQMLFKSSEVKATVKLDPSLIGGIKVAVGDKLYDASIKGKLSRLLSAMTV